MVRNLQHRGRIQGLLTGATSWLRRVSPGDPVVIQAALRGHQKEKSGHEVTKVNHVTTETGIAMKETKNGAVVVNEGVRETRRVGMMKQDAVGEENRRLKVLHGLRCTMIEDTEMKGREMICHHESTAEVKKVRHTTLLAGEEA